MSEARIKSITIPRLGTKEPNDSNHIYLEISPPESYEKKEIVVPLIRVIEENFPQKEKRNLSPEEKKIQDETKELERVRKNFEEQYKATIQLLEMQKQDIYQREQQFQYKVAAANAQLKSYWGIAHNEKQQLRDEIIIIRTENNQLKKEIEKMVNVLTNLGVDPITYGGSHYSVPINSPVNNQSFNIQHSSKVLPNVTLNGRNIEIKKQETPLNSKKNSFSVLPGEQDLSPPTKQTAEITMSPTKECQQPSVQPMFDIKRPPKPSERKSLVVGPKVETHLKPADSLTNSNSSLHSSTSSTNSSGSPPKKHRHKKRVKLSSQILDDSDSPVFDE